jgi:prohibitin 2
MVIWRGHSSLAFGLGGDSLTSIFAMISNLGGKLAGGVILLFLVAILGSSSTYVVEPGHRGVLVTLGKVSEGFKPEGFGLKPPVISRVHQQTVQRQTGRMEAGCYSSDLQQVVMEVKVLYLVPEGQVVTLYRDFEGEVFDSLIEPRVAEALKEVTALRRAEEIVQQREQVKSMTLDAAQAKVGNLLVIEDVVLEDIKLTDILESSIEEKMVREQEAARARFSQQQAEVEAETKVIEAKGEADAIRLQGKALRENPSVLDLMVVSQWDGVTPLVAGSGLEGTEFLLPMGKAKAFDEQEGAVQE